MHVLVADRGASRLGHSGRADREPEPALDEEYMPPAFTSLLGRSWIWYGSGPYETLQPRAARELMSIEPMPRFRCGSSVNRVP